MKKISTWIIFLLTIILAFIVSLIVRTNTSDDIPQQREYDNNSSFNLAKYFSLHPVVQGGLIDHFPYAAYLDSANFRSIKTISNDLQILDSVNAFDKRENQKTISRLLTTELGLRSTAYFNTYCPDSLLVLIQWAEKFQTYAEQDSDNKLLYHSIYHYWMDSIGHCLQKFLEEKPSRKYDFKFRYLRTRCKEQRISMGTKVTSTEKGINNLIYGKWGHFINASWNQTSLLQKIVFLLIVSFTLYGYSCIIQKHLLK